MSSKILLIEDDPRLADMVIDYLSQNGFDLHHATTGAEGISNHASLNFDAIILDLMLPDMDGLDICRSIRTKSETPILMLTARGDAMDRVVGLEMGADDYLPKPFEPRELLARLRAILRRGVRKTTSSTLNFGRLEIDLEAILVRLDDKVLTLTSYQFELLKILALNSGRVMSRDAIMDHLKKQTIESFDRSIDVHISRIRSEIEDDPKNPRRIITVRGMGYVFAKMQN